MANHHSSPCATWKYSIAYMSAAVVGQLCDATGTTSLASDPTTGARSLALVNVSAAPPAVVISATASPPFFLPNPNKFLV
jgi:hypothetical protein